MPHTKCLFSSQLISAFRLSCCPCVPVPVPWPVPGPVSAPAPLLSLSVAASVASVWLGVSSGYLQAQQINLQTCRRQVQTLNEIEMGQSRRSSREKRRSRAGRGSRRISRLQKDFVVCGLCGSVLVVVVVAFGAVINTFAEF